MDPATIALIAGIASSALGGLFSNRKGVTNQTQNIDNWADTWNKLNQTNFNMASPEYDPAAWNFRNELMARVLSRLNLMDPNVAAESVTTQNVQGINSAAELQRKALESLMRQRGLSFSPMGASMLGMFDANRISQVANTFNQRPLLARQFQQENENMLNARQQLAQQLFGMIPYASKSEGFSNQFGEGRQHNYGTVAGSTTSPGNMLGGLFTGIGGPLAYYGILNQGPSTGNSNPGNVNSNYKLPTLPVGTLYGKPIP